MQYLDRLQSRFAGLTNRQADHAISVTIGRVWCAMHGQSATHGNREESAEVDRPTARRVDDLLLERFRHLVVVD